MVVFKFAWVKMSICIFLALLCFNLIECIRADGENKCRVDTNIETRSTSIYCYYMKLDDKEVPLDSAIQPSDYVSLHLIDCNGSITENSFSNLKEVSSISISATLDKFVLPDLPKLNYIQIDKLQTPTLKGAFRNVEDTLTSIKFDNNPFLLNKEDLEGLSNLESLSLVNQNVTDLGFLKDKKKLNELIIIQSNIKTIPKDTFKNNRENVDRSQPPRRRICPVNSLMNIESLGVHRFACFNFLIFHPKTYKNFFLVVSGLSSMSPDELTSIEFSNVPLQVIEDGPFDDLQNLKMLLMTTTDLTTFDADLTKNLKNLQGLGIPARSVKTLDVGKLLENCPNLGAFYFTTGDMKCSETQHLQDKISKHKRLIGVAYAGGSGDYFKTC
ncbi:uncharacterized protein LOC130895707 isoform X1 [Diorhabda carinulata]|uniref:uncharacterized protein LOC130895707 isoform X1 n=1 Tax=Diorhabda carinulata TaxID=1163345 RepID=UPI0025A0DBAD|nr:uncharacterized protein LOC130895707 isoform X1 [Diorhabda carinulata]